MIIIILILIIFIENNNLINDNHPLHFIQNYLANSGNNWVSATTEEESKSLNIDAIISSYTELTSNSNTDDFYREIFEVNM